jgi:hypothetical protein
MVQKLPVSTHRPQTRTWRHRATATRLRTASYIRYIAFCVLPALVVLGGCNGCEDKKVELAPAPDLPAVPAPADLAADIFVPNPEAAFKNIRTRVAGPLTLLPATFPSMMVTVLGLTPQLLEQIDGKSPAFGVITDDGKRVVVVMGVHVRNGPRTVQLLTEGADAKYTAKANGDGVTLLEPKPTLTSRAAALGVAGNYLLSAETAEDLVRCGPYVTRTLPKRPKQEGEIVLVAPGSALKGPIVKRIRETWDSFREDREKEDEELRKNKGRKPDFGEPAAALADVGGKVETITTLLSDLSDATLRIDTDATGIHAKMTMTPASDSGAAAMEFSSMVVGDLAPLLAMPQDTVLGVLLRDNEQGRAKGAKDQAAGLAKLLGDRITDKEREAVEAALSSWALGRGDWLVAALRWTRTEQEAIVRGAVSDPKSLDEGIRSLLALGQVPAFREPIEARLGKMALGKPAKVGAGSLLHVDREKKVPKGAKPETSAFDLAWRIDEAKGFEMRGREDGKGWLTAESAPKVPTLGEHPTTSKVFTGIGDDATFALFVDPQLFVASIAPKGAKLREASAPFVFAYGGAKKEGWVRVALSHATARELVKMLGRRTQR